MKLIIHYPKHTIAQEESKERLTKIIMQSIEKYLDSASFEDPLDKIQFIDKLISWVENMQTP